MSVVGARNSNLSGGRFGYDLVVAVTQKSVNATFKEFLDKSESLPTFSKCFVYNPAYKPGEDAPQAIETDYDALVAAVGFDIFDIPSNTPVSDPRIQKLLTEHKFKFAYQTTAGLPEDFAISDIPDTISFKGDGHSTVTYSMTNKTFKIASLKPDFFTGGEWKVLSQEDSDKPWTFEMQINLDLRTDGNVITKFQQLPPDAQARVKNLGYNMFSIQQLFLDLNTARLADSPTIVGMDVTSEEYVFLQGYFVNAYLKNLTKGTNGEVMLGYAVTEKENPRQDTASIVPTDLNFSISAYKDEKGKATEDYDLYTLNYLVMSKNRMLPPPTSFDWNWIDQTESKDYHGTMAVKRGVIAMFLQDLLSPHLRKVCFRPTVDISIKNPVSAKFSWSVKMEPDQQRYSLVEAPGSHVLSFTYSKHESDSDTFVPIWGNISLTTTTTSNIYFEGNIIRSVNKTEAKCHLNIEGGVTEGTWARYETQANYQIVVDDHGHVSVSAVEGSPNFKDTSESIDANGWSQFVTFGTVDALLKKIKGTITGIKEFLTGFEKNIQDTLNGSKSWVFPGGQTFAFKDIYFSEHQDLVSHVLYASTG